ncbi:hypothetical protein BpHYR1_015344, partial [Brachionus plicatilis]
LRHIVGGRVPPRRRLHRRLLAQLCAAGRRLRQISTPVGREQGVLGKCGAEQIFDHGHHQTGVCALLAGQMVQSSGHTGPVRARRVLFDGGHWRRLAHHRRLLVHLLGHLLRGQLPAARSQRLRHLSLPVRPAQACALWRQQLAQQHHSVLCVLPHRQPRVLGQQFWRQLRNTAVCDRHQQAGQVGWRRGQVQVQLLSFERKIVK